MRVVYGLENLDRPCGPAVLTIGNFDGVHLGHQDIFREEVSQAQRRGLLSVVMTFEYNPLRVLAPERAPPTLAPLELKLASIKRFGLGLAVVLRCTRETLDLRAEEFIRDVLVKCFELEVIVEGPNFRFGKDRVGTVEFLIEQGPKFGFETIKVEPHEADLPGMGKQMISSSLVRRFLSEGMVDLAEVCLGRPYELVGRVVPGVGRGRSLGFPTANLDTGEQMLPAAGIYAAWVQVDGGERPCAVNIGPSPTFGEYGAAVEAYIIDYSGELYGRQLGLKFKERLRASRKFESRSDLVDQIRQDVEAVKELLRVRRDRVEQ